MIDYDFVQCFPCPETNIDRVEYVRSLYPSVLVIENRENLGFAGGNNDGNGGCLPMMLARMISPKKCSVPTLAQPFTG